MHDVAYGRYRFETPSNTGNYLDSMEELLLRDAYTSQRIGGKSCTSGSSTALVRNLNALIAAFLDMDFDWLFLTDTDMGFRPDTLDRLLEAAHPEHHPAVSALSFMYQHTDPDGLNGVLGVEQPVILDWLPGEGDRKPGFVSRLTYPQDTVVQCHATGLACTVIHRTVFEKIHERFGAVWVDPMAEPTTGAMMTPDVSFWIRAGMVDAPCHVHTGVHTNHQKSCWVSHVSYAARLAEAGKSPHDGYDAPTPEPEQTPVRNRAEKRRLARSKA